MHKITSYFAKQKNYVATTNLVVNRSVLFILLYGSKFCEANIS